VKARNLAANPACVASTERGHEAVVVEGRAEALAAGPELAPVYEAYKAKYDWPMDAEPFYRLQPTVAFGFIEHADQFTATATRWRFS